MWSKNFYESDDGEGDFKDTCYICGNRNPSSTCAECGRKICRICGQMASKWAGRGNRRTAFLCSDCLSRDNDAGRSAWIDGERYNRWK